MKYGFLLCFVLCALCVYTNAQSRFTSIASVNTQWYHPLFYDAAKEYNNEFIEYPLSEVEHVRLHLKSVEELLRSRRVEGLDDEQLRERKHNLTLLHSYWKSGSFPRNITHHQRIPVFVDYRNVPCAVGYLMLCAGYTDFVEKVRAKSNNIYIREIQSDVFTQFQKQSGFTLDELALIQPSYGEHMVYTKIPTSDNACITAMAVNDAKTLLYVAGNFSSLQNTAVENIAMYDGITWQPVEPVLRGTIHAMAVVGQDLFVAGNLLLPGSTTPVHLVKHHQNIWKVIDCNDTVRCLYAKDGKLYVGGAFTRIDTKNIAYFASYNTQTNTWQSENAKFDAPVNAITMHKGDLVVGGEFKHNGELGHIYLSQLSKGQWESLPSPFVRPITALFSGSYRRDPQSTPISALYAGTALQGEITENDLIVAFRADTGWRQPYNSLAWKMQQYGLTQNPRIVSFELVFSPYYGNATLLALAQDETKGQLFDVGDGFATPNGNILEATIPPGRIAPVAKYFLGRLYIAPDSGSFVHTDLRILSVESMEQSSGLNIRSNANGEIVFSLSPLHEGKGNIMIVDILGNAVYSSNEQYLPDTITVPAHHLSRGTYCVRIQTGDKTYNAKFILEE